MSIRECLEQEHRDDFTQMGIKNTEASIMGDFRPDSVVRVKKVRWLKRLEKIMTQ